MYGLYSRAAYDGARMVVMIISKNFLSTLLVYQRDSKLQYRVEIGKLLDIYRFLVAPTKAK